MDQETSGYMQEVPPLKNMGGWYFGTPWPTSAGRCPYCNPPPPSCPTCGRPYLGGPAWNHATCASGDKSASSSTKTD